MGQLAFCYSDAGGQFPAATQRPYKRPSTPGGACPRKHTSQLRHTINQLRNHLQPQRTTRLPIPNPIQTRKQTPRKNQPRQPILLRKPLTHILPTTPLQRPIKPIPLKSYLRQKRNRLAPQTRHLHPIPQAKRKQQIRTKGQIPPIKLQPRFLHTTIIRRRQTTSRMQISRPLHQTSPRTKQQLIQATSPTTQSRTHHQVQLTSHRLTSTTSSRIGQPKLARTGPLARSKERTTEQCRTFAGHIDRVTFRLLNFPIRK